MPRKKKVEEIKEEVTPMVESALNLPETPNREVFMKIVAPSAAVNVRDAAGGNKMFTVPNMSKVGVLEETEVDGVKWTKIYGYVMSEYVKEM